MIDLNYEVAQLIKQKASEARDVVQQKLYDIMEADNLDAVLASASKTKIGLIPERGDGRTRVVEITVNVAEKPFVEKSPGSKVPREQMRFGIVGEGE